MKKRIMLLLVSVGAFVAGLFTGRLFATYAIADQARRAGRIEGEESAWNDLVRKVYEDGETLQFITDTKGRSVYFTAIKGHPSEHMDY